jgi:hypothetical protein
MWAGEAEGRPQLTSKLGLFHCFLSSFNILPRGPTLLDLKK